MVRKTYKTRMLEGGRVTIPKAVRKMKGWIGGERLIVETTPEGAIHLRLATAEELAAIEA